MDLAGRQHTNAFTSVIADQRRGIRAPIISGLMQDVARSGMAGPRASAAPQSSKMHDTQFFSHEPFLEAVATTCFPGKKSKIQTISVAGKQFRVCVIDGRIAEHPWHHFFYYEPFEHAPSLLTRRVPYLTNACLGVEPASTRSYALSMPVAPFIDWRLFPTFEDFRSFTRTLPSPPLWRRVAAYRRSLQRTYGDVQFIPDDRHEDALSSLFSWKSAQLRRWGMPDCFADPACVALYHALAERRLLTLSTLRAGGRLIAGIAGYGWGGRRCLRLIAHDPDLSRYSPGQMVLQDVLFHSFTSGDSQIDFMRGAFTYKFTFATHVRLLGSISRQSRRQQLGNWLPSRIKKPGFRLLARLAGHP